jgi:hypothetical protein
MGTLAGCLKKTKGLSADDKASIKAYAAEYYAENIEGTKANLSAVNDYISEIAEERSGIVRQIKEQVPDWKEPKRPKLRTPKEAKVEPEAVKEAKPEAPAPKSEAGPKVAEVAAPKKEETQAKKKETPAPESKKEAAPKKAEPEPKPWTPPTAKELFTKEELSKKKGGPKKPPLYSKAYHGTPHKFDKFTLENIGTGEGAQAFGYGLYFAGEKEVAEFYKDKLGAFAFTHKGVGIDPESPKQIAAELLWGWQGDVQGALEDAEGFGEEATAIIRELRTLNYEELKQGGQLLEVEIPDDDVLLYWDKPLARQPTKVREILKKSGISKDYNRNLQDFTSPQITRNREKKGHGIYAYLEHRLGGDKAASEHLNSLGIKGIKYLDEGSRDVGRGTYNYVVFDDAAIEIVNRYSKGQSKTYATTPADIQTELRKGWLGRKAFNSLSESGRVTIVESSKDLPAGIPLETANGTKGVYLGDGKVILVADKIEPGKASDVFLHEAAHAILADDKGYQQQKGKIISDFERLGELGNKKIKAAFDQVPANTPEEFRVEEALGYFLESNPQHSLVKRVMAAIRAALMRLGVKLNQLSEADLVALFKQGAHAWAKREAVPTGTPPGRVAFSKQLATTPEAQALVAKLEKLYGKAGKISPAKTKRMIDRYEKLVTTLEDDKVDIFEKQKELEAHIVKELRPEERFKVLPAIKSIAKPKTEKGRQAALARAILKVEEAHQRFAKKDSLAKIDKMLKKKGIGGKKASLPTHKQMEPEGRELIGWAQKARDNEELAVEKLLEYAEREDSGSERDVQALTSMEENERAMIHLMLGLGNKSLEEIQAVEAELKYIIDNSRATWQAAEKKRKDEWKEKRDGLVKNITKGKADLGQFAERQEVQAKGIFKKAKEMLGTLEDAHISFPMLMDKLVSADKSFKPLENPLAEHYVRLAYDATHDEHNNNQARAQSLQNALLAIYGTDKSVASTFKQNEVVVADSGVTIHSADLLGVERDNDPSTGEESWRVGTAFFTDKKEAQAYAKESNRQAAKESRRQIPLSKEVAGTMWMQLQQDSIAEDLFRQGVDDTTRKELEKFLGPKVLDQARWFLNSYEKEWSSINDVHKARYYVNMAKIASYSPIKRRIQNETADQAMLRQQSMHASMTPGAIHGRVKNSRELLFEPMTSVYLRHMVEMEHFKSWALPMWEMRSVFGSEAVQGALAQNSPSSKKALNRFTDDFARGGVDRSKSIKILDQVRANFAVAAIGLKPVILLKQLASIPGYAQDIPVKDFTAGLAYAMANPLKAKAELMGSKVMKHRGLSGHERDVALALEKAEARAITGKKTLREWAMTPAMVGDQWAIVLGGYGVYKYHLDKFKKKGMSDSQARTEALHKFDAATARSQQSAEIMDRGWIERQGSIGSLFTMFMSSQAGYTRNSMLAIRSIAGRRGNLTDNMKRLAVNWVVLNGLFAIVSAGGEWDTEEVLSATVAGPLNGLAFIRDGSSAMLTALFEGRAYGSAGTPPPFTTANKAAYAMTKAHKLITEGYDEDRMRAMLFDVLEIAAYMTGLPLQGAMRVGEGVKAVTEGEDLRRGLGYTEKNLED